MHDEAPPEKIAKLTPSSQAVAPKGAGLPARTLNATDLVSSAIELSISAIPPVLLALQTKDLAPLKLAEFAVEITDLRSLPHFVKEPRSLVRAQILGGLIKIDAALASCMMKF